MLPINQQRMFVTTEEIHSYGIRFSKKRNVNVKFGKTKRKNIN